MLNLNTVNSKFHLIQIFGQTFAAVFTDRVQSRGKVMFILWNVCLSTQERYPILSDRGVPPPFLTNQTLGYPPGWKWMVPPGWDWMGVPPVWDWMGVPPRHSQAWTRYAMVSMPLVVSCRRTFLYHFMFKMYS